MEHALRTCLLAVRIGEALRLNEAELVDSYHLALLRFIGCTAESSQEARILGDEVELNSWLTSLTLASNLERGTTVLRHVGAGSPPWERLGLLGRAIAGTRYVQEIEVAHCEVARLFAARLSMTPTLQRAIGQIYERFDGKGTPNRLRGENIELSMRVVAVAHDAQAYERLGGVDAATAVVKSRSGKSYDPAVAEAFGARPTELLAGLGSENIWDRALEVEPGPRALLTESQLDKALEVVADFSDLKSIWTRGHSRAVAGLASSAAEVCGRAIEEQTRLRRAGLMHDTGRVGVTSAIWDKPGPLSTSEWERLRLHPYYTERIFAHLGSLTPLGTLAAMHHERLDGSGYHKGLNGSALPFAARLLAAADAYQTKTSPRPHRPALPPDDAASAMHEEARAGKLDREAVSAVLAAAGHPQEARRANWPAGLTDREVEVLRLIAAGHSKRQIAQSLTISQHTAGHHVRHIYDKLGVSTRAAAAVFAMQHDLL